MFGQSPNFSLPSDPSHLQQLNNYVRSNSAKPAQTDAVLGGLGSFDQASLPQFSFGIEQFENASLYAEPTPAELPSSEGEAYVPVGSQAIGQDALFQTGSIGTGYASGSLAGIGG